MDGSADRISALPEAIQHHIFSFLLAKDVMQAAATCKRLNQVWTTLPFLDLGKDFFPALPLPPVDSDDDDCEEVDMEALYPNLPEIRRRREKLFNFVEQTLSRWMVHGLTIQKIRICVNVLDIDLSRHLDRWMHYLVQCNIKELVLKISRDIMYYDLPPVLFRATSLHTLTLKHCRMPVQCDSITLSSLRKLHLKRLYLADQTIGEIISTSHNLEDLNFKYCRGMKRIVVSAQPQLRVLTMRHHRKGQVLEEVVVGATNLEKFTYSTPNLMCKINILTKFDGKLKCLHLGGANITNMQFCEMMSRLPRLEELQLAQLNMNAITISSSSLKRLKLGNLFDFGASGVGGKVTIEAPNLAYFYFTGCFTTEFVNNVAAKEVILQINDIDSEKNAEILCRKWVQFLCKFDNSEVVRLDSLYFEKIVVPAKLKLLAPLPRIKHLIVEGRFNTSPVDVIGELIHSLIQISPNLETLSLEDNGYVYDASPINLVIKFYPNKVVGSHDCFTFPWRCGMHCMTHMIVDLNGTSDDAKVYQSLRNYFMNNAELLKEINGHSCNIRF